MDFALRKGGNIERLVQVSHASGGDEAEKRDLKALTEASDWLKCKDMLVVRWDYADELDSGRKKLVHTPMEMAYTVKPNPLRLGGKPPRSISAPYSQKPLRGPTAP